MNGPNRHFSRFPKTKRKISFRMDLHQTPNYDSIAVHFLSKFYKTICSSDLSPLLSYYARNANIFLDNKALELSAESLEEMYDKLDLSNSAVDFSKGKIKTTPLLLNSVLLQVSGSFKTKSKASEKTLSFTQSFILCPYPSSNGSTEVYLILRDELIIGEETSRALQQKTKSQKQTAKVPQAKNGKKPQEKKPVMEKAIESVKKSAPGSYAEMARKAKVEKQVSHVVEAQEPVKPPPAAKPEKKVGFPVHVSMKGEGKVSQDDLREYLKQYGEVTRFTFKGHFALADFLTDEAKQQAIESEAGTLSGSTIVISDKRENKFEKKDKRKQTFRVKKQ
eukprot:snap_masked-scaffold_2-processed-gene-3.12-mRNA-1 protein AED:1.00 eAED:1.00 QI:0/-1/0/0/-1/1/1/0/334